MSTKLDKDFVKHILSKNFLNNEKIDRRIEEENFILSKINKIRIDTILAVIGKYKCDFDSHNDGWKRISDPDEEMIMELE